MRPRSAALTFFRSLNVNADVRDATASPGTELSLTMSWSAIPSRKYSSVESALPENGSTAIDNVHETGPREWQEKIRQLPVLAG